MVVLLHLHLLTAFLFHSHMPYLKPLMLVEHTPYLLVQLRWPLLYLAVVVMVMVLVVLIHKRVVMEGLEVTLVDGMTTQ